MSGAEEKELGFHRTKGGLINFANPAYCATQLESLAQKVEALTNELAQDRRDKTKLYGDVKVLQATTKNCTTEKRELGDKIQEVDSKVTTKIQEVDTKVNSIKVARETSADERGHAEDVGFQNRRFWLTVVGISLSLVIALGGMGFWGSARSDRLAKQIDNLSQDKSVQEDSRKLLDEMKKILSAYVEKGH